MQLVMVEQGMETMATDVDLAKSTERPESQEQQGTGKCAPGFL